MKHCLWNGITQVHDHETTGQCVTMATLIFYDITVSMVTIIWGVIIARVTCHYCNCLRAKKKHTMYFSLLAKVNIWSILFVRYCFTYFHKRWDQFVMLTPYLDIYDIHLHHCFQKKLHMDQKSVASTDPPTGGCTDPAFCKQLSSTGFSGTARLMKQIPL